MTTVGVVGLGAMGRPVASRLAAAGFPTVGFDRSGRPEPDVDGGRCVGTLAGVAADSGVEFDGGRCVGTLAEVAADIVFVIVPTDDDVAGVVDGLLPALAPRSVIAVSSSVRPETCHRLATRAAAHDVDLLDVALTGGIRGAETGTLNLLVGGDAAVVDRLHDVFAAIATGHHLLGPVGAGQVAKAASNLIHWAEIVAIEEALRLAADLGVAPKALRAALQEGGTDSRTLRELELMHFTWWAKDLANLHEMAPGDLPVARLAGHLMRTVTPERIRALLA